MKQLLLILIFAFVSYQSEAQLASGTALPSNIKTTDIKGDTVDVFKWLSEGKTVVIDVFATWCGPCWSFHNSGYLKDLHAQYGPDGTDQLRIIGLEADGNTAESTLYSSSWGDWTEGVKYHIVDNHTYNSMLKISFFPTLYIIRPNKRVLEIGEYRYNQPIWQKAMFPDKAIDIIPVLGLESKTFCNKSSFSQKPTIINLGSEDINHVKINFFRNGELKEIENNHEVPVFKELSLPLPTINQFDVSTVFEAVVTHLNNTELPESEQLKFECSYLRPIVEELNFKVKFTTDYYPGQTSWELTDNQNRSIFKKSYNPGPSSSGAGGSDANRAFIHDIILPDADITCLTLTISDAANNGIASFNPTVNPIPGVEIIKSDGTVIKPKMASDYDFSSSKSILSRFLLSSDTDETVAQNFSIYPNPASELIHIQKGNLENLTYKVFVTDMVGRQVTQTVENANFLNVQELQSGMYFINIHTEKGMATFKFTKS